MWCSSVLGATERHITFSSPPLCAVIDVQAFERLLGSCKEIMKRNIAHYEEQLVALFGSSMDLRDWASHTTLRAFFYKHTNKHANRQTNKNTQIQVLSNIRKWLDGLVSFTPGARLTCKYMNPQFSNTQPSSFPHTQTHALGTERRPLLDVCSPSSTSKLNRFLDKLTLVRCKHTHSLSHTSCHRPPKLLLELVSTSQYECLTCGDLLQAEQCKGMNYTHTPNIFSIAPWSFISAGSLFTWALEQLRLVPSLSQGHIKNTGAHMWWQV